MVVYHCTGMYIKSLVYIEVVYNICIICIEVSLVQRYHGYMQRYNYVSEVLYNWYNYIERDIAEVYHWYRGITA